MVTAGTLDGKFSKPSKFQKIIYGQEGPLSLPYPPPSPLPLRKVIGKTKKPIPGASGPLGKPLGPGGPTGQQGPQETKGDTRHSFSEMLSIFVLTYQDHPSTTVIITKYRVLNRCQK